MASPTAVLDRSARRALLFALQDHFLIGTAPDEAAADTLSMLVENLPPALIDELDLNRPDLALVLAGLGV